MMKAPLRAPGIPGPSRNPVEPGKLRKARRRIRIIGMAISALAVLLTPVVIAHMPGMYDLLGVSRAQSESWIESMSTAWIAIFSILACFLALAEIVDLS